MLGWRRRDCAGCLGIAMNLPLPLPKSRDDIRKIQSERKRVAFERAKKIPWYRGKLDPIDPAKLTTPSTGAGSVLTRNAAAAGYASFCASPCAGDRQANTGARRSTNTGILSTFRGHRYGLPPGDGRFAWDRRATSTSRFRSAFIRLAGGAARARSSRWRVGAGNVPWRSSSRSSNPADRIHGMGSRADLRTRGGDRHRSRGLRCARLCARGDAV